MASAWLIRRFIDRDASFVWFAAPAGCPKKALGFDFDGSAFIHFGGHVSLEVLAASFALRGDPAFETACPSDHPHAKCRQGDLDD